MGIVKKTKEERKADAAKVYQTRPDTPLGESPDPTAPVTDLKSALSDINTRSAARQASLNASQKVVDAARAERSRQKRSIAGGEGSRLSGLASFASTTGRTKQQREKE